MLKVLREKRATAIADMRAILDLAATESRELTEGETSTFDAKQAAVATLDASIARASTLETLEASLAAPVASVGARQRVTAAPGPEAKREFESLNEFMAAAICNPNDSRLASLYAEQRMDTGGKGGFQVPRQFLSTLLKVDPQTAIVRPRATVLPAGSPPDAAIDIPALDQRTGTNASPGNVFGGVTFAKTDEGGDKPETDVDFRMITLQPQEFSGHIVATDRLLNNWSAAGAFFESQMRAAMVAKEDFEFLRGNGVGGPIGVINAGATYTVARETNSQFTRTDVNNMVSRILMREGNPVWVLSRSLMPQLLNMRNEIGSPAVGDGALVFQPSVVPGMPSMLAGFPIIWNERSPGITAKGTALLADFGKYLVKDGSGPFVASSEHVYFLKNKTAIKLYWLVDGQPWLTEPFVGEDNYEVSPFVALGANT